MRFQCLSGIFSVGQINHKPLNWWCIRIVSQTPTHYSGKGRTASKKYNVFAKCLVGDKLLPPHRKRRTTSVFCTRLYMAMLSASDVSRWGWHVKALWKKKSDQNREWTAFGPNFRSLVYFNRHECNFNFKRWYILIYSHLAPLKTVLHSVPLILFHLHLAPQTEEIF